MSDEPVKTELSGISAWRWPSVTVLVAALGLVAFIYFIKTPERLVTSTNRLAPRMIVITPQSIAGM